MDKFYKDLNELRIYGYGYGEYIATEDSSLKEILNSMKVRFLKLLADSILPIDIYLYANRFKKVELCKAIYEQILSDNYLELLMKGSSEEQLFVIKELLDGNKVNLQQYDQVVLPLFYNGILFIDFSKLDNPTIVIPKELKEILKDKIPLIDYMEKVIINEIYSYAKACGNLYGVLTFNEALDIYNHYHPNKKMKFYNYLEYFVFAQGSRKEISIYQNLICSEYIFFNHEDDFEEYIDDLILARENKSLYMPSKDNFLKYESHYYFEYNIAHNQLRDKLNKHLKDKDEVDFTFHYILTMIRADEPTSLIMDFLENSGIQFNSEAEFHDFFKLIIIINNTSHKWHNAGHTPLAIRKTMLD